MKINKFINFRGSFLIMLIIILSILMILGTTILTIAVTNFKMKSIEGKIKTNFYLAEAGLEEAYGIIGELVEEAIELGNQEAKDYLNSIDIQLELKKVKQGEKSNYVLPDGTINYNKINREMNNMFTTTYKHQIKNNIRTYLENSNNFKIEYLKTKPRVKVANSPEFLNDTLEIELISTYTKDNIKKKVRAVYEIKVPDYNQPYYEITTVINTPYNITWKKVISTDGSVIISGNTQIIGDTIILGNLIVEDKDIPEHTTVHFGSTINFNISKNKNKNTNNDILTDSYSIERKQNISYDNIFKLDDDNEIQGLHEKINTETQLTVSDLVDFNKITNKLKHSNGNLVYFNNNENEHIILIGKKATYEDINSLHSDIIKIDISDEDTIWGIIITKGDIYMVGEINYYGGIISKGDIYTYDNKQKTLTHDEEYIVKKILDNNLTSKNNIFKFNSSETVPINTQKEIGTDGILVNIYKDKLIEIKEWMIIH